MPVKLFNSLPGSQLYETLHRTQEPAVVPEATGSNALLSTQLEDGARARSMYSAAYPAPPTNAYGTAKLGASAPRRASAPWAEPTGHTLQGSTTYNQEILDGSAFSKQQLAEVQDVPYTTVDYSASHRHGGLDTKLRTSAGLHGPVGYRTEYETAMGARTDPKMNASATVGAKGFGNSQSLGSTLTSNEQGPLIKAHSSSTASVPLGKSSVQTAPSSYTLDMGAPNTDPLERTANSAATMTPTACTQDLAQGTARATSQRIPGYAGHVGTTTILSDSIKNEAREPGTLLLELSQYPRERVPGCTKHFPQAARNIRPAPPAAPIVDDDWAQCTAGGSPFAINSRKGIISFFNTGTSQFESENGMNEAQRYYQTQKLRGRRFKV